jgi:phosphonate transport system substrate-binding protein
MIMKKILLLTIILICYGSTSVYAEDQKLSMLPRYFPEKLTAMITPLAAYLSTETSISFEPILMDNFAHYEAELLKGKVAIGYENPLVYINISNSHEVIATAVKGKGGNKFRGIIISRPDSGISKISALKGKKIMIVSKASAGGFLSQKLTLRENGLDVERDCEISIAADNRQENVIISVSIGDVDAGFIRESALHKADQYIMPGSVKAVADTAWLPNWALSVSRDMQQSQKDIIQKALLKLDRDSPVLQAMGLNSFIAASDSDYEILRTLKE